MGTGIFSHVKQPGHEVDHSPKCGVAVKNEWSYTSTPIYAFMVWTDSTLPLL
jgi:hypothetical protein